MTISRWIIAAVAAAFVLPGPALGATGGAKQLLYFVTGVTDSGAGVNAGVATILQCSTFSSTAEDIQVIIFDVNGMQLVNNTFLIPALSTRTAGTHLTAAFNENVSLNSGLVQHGMAFVLATTTAMVCTAMVVDAAAAAPAGLPLHGMRFNAHPGSME